MNVLKQTIALLKRGKNENGIPLQRRLIVFLTASTVFLIMLFTSLLMIFGIVGSNYDVKSYLASELSHISRSIENDFGKLSLQGIALSESISESTEKFCMSHNTTVAGLKNNPMMLTPLLSNLAPKALDAMSKNVCSGAFIMLDATVNPFKDNANHSKAGVFFKHTQPNLINNIGSRAHCLRGPAEIARENKVELLGQWKMEFQTNNEHFFEDVISVAKSQTETMLSRLYFWTDCFTLEENSEKCILLCVPLRSKDGDVFGICGFEVSARLFKQKYTPNDSNYRNVFTCAAPFEQETLYMKRGMIAGNSFLTGSQTQSSVKIKSDNNGFLLYTNENVSYSGMQTPLKLYPTGSPYKNQEWLVSVMMPQEVLSQAVNGKNMVLYIIVISLMIISFFVSVFISRKYMRPVTEAIDAIKTKSYRAEMKKNIYLEINDLMEFLAQQEEKPSQNNVIKSEISPSTPMFETFMENLKMLSNAERKVFDLYLEGYKAQEIADKLFLSINTIKTHNRRIFSKLNVSTRKELLIYIDMMKEKNYI